MKYGLIIIACLTLTNMAFSQEAKEAIDKKYGSNNTIFIKSAGSIDEALKEAKIKMNSLD